MSFALEYRKKLQAQQRDAQVTKKANEGFVAEPVETASDTTSNRRRVFLVLVLAGGILATFNSGGLVNYTQGLADKPMGPQLILASERWHELMQEKKITRVVDHIRGFVAFVRDTSWQDLAIGLKTSTAEIPTEPTKPPLVLPASTVPTIKRPVSPEPRMARPAGPVMRASVERLP
jgi:hypothetical protein